MLKLSLDALEILDAIDRRGSFSAAGKELHRVPSTISYTVSKLEEDLGVQVFERAGPKIALTPAGQELLKEGRYLLRAASNLESRVRRVASGWETEITLGLDLIFTPLALEQDISEFYQLAEQTRLRLVTEAMTGTWEALLDRRIDLLIGGSSEGPSGGGYATEPLGEVRFVFAVAPGHPLAKIDRPLVNADLQAYRAIAVADTARRLAPRTVGLSFGQDALAVPDMQTKLAYQIAGLGSGFLPEAYAAEAIRQGRLVEKEVKDKRQVEMLYLAWRTEEEGKALMWWRERIINKCKGQGIAPLMPRF